jgi:hypothetical protein
MYKLLIYAAETSEGPEIFTVKKTANFHGENLAAFSAISSGLFRQFQNPRQDLFRRVSIFAVDD